MGTQLIVMVTPSRDRQSGMAQVAEPVGIQAFVAQATVEEFDDTVLHRLARLDVIEPDASLVAPGLKPVRTKLRAVIGANLLWPRPVVEDLFERQPRKRCRVVQPHVPLRTHTAAGGSVFRRWHFQTTACGVRGGEGQMLLIDPSLDCHRPTHSRARYGTCS